MPGLQPPLSSARVWAVPLASAVMVAVCALGGVNRPLFLALNGALGPGHEVLWSNLTNLGDTLVVLALALPFAGRRPDIAWAVVIAALVATVLSHGIKEFWPVPRPAGVLDDASFHLIGRRLRLGAFPSGHTTAITTLAGVLCLHSRRILPVAVLMGIAVVVGVSRIAVGAHWPADVAGGWAIGWVAAVAGVWLARASPAGTARAAQTLIALFLLGCAAWLTVYATGYPLALRLQQLIAACCAIAGLLNLYRMWRPPPSRG